MLLFKSCYKTLDKRIDTTDISSVILRNNKLIIKSVNNIDNYNNEKNILLHIDKYNSKLLIKLIDYWVKETNYCLVFNYYKKGDLYNYLHKKIPLNINKVKKIFIKMVHCVKECHNVNVIHGDIKLENFLINNDNDYILIDFGMSIISKQNYVYSTNNKGTPLYNSPEYKLGIISFKSDIWSLGIILYLLLHGYYPHDEASYNINYKFNIPLQVRDIINNMLIINYKFRYSIDDILNHDWINS
jgi:serine/threonine protein kinase